MNILIETYRGFPIYFVTDSERFTCEIDPGSWKDKQSFASAKKFVDDYLKDNKEFKPFIICYKTGTNKKKITGIRKDGRFVYQAKGKNEQLSQYDESNYIVYNESDEKKFAHLATLEAEVVAAEKKVSEYLSTITGETLADIRKKYLTT